MCRLWGVGPATQRRLDRLGVRTIGDLAAYPPDALERAVGHAHGAHLHALAHNVDDRPVEPDRQAKSIGHEETFPTDVTDRARLDQDLLRYAERVAARLRDHGAGARTVQLKARYADFRTVTRSRTLAAPTDLAADLARVGRELLAALPLGDGLRLLGLSAQQLVDVAELQPALPFGDDDDPVARARQVDLERTLDDVRHRFGDQAVSRATHAGRGPGPRR